MRAHPLPILLALVAASPARAQNHTCDSLRDPDVHVPQYDHGVPPVRSLSELMINTYMAERPPSYVVPMPAEAAVQSHNGPAPLQEGEGRRGYTFEANVDLFFPFASGRNSTRLFGSGFRAGVLFNNTIRMANDFSHPVLPGNWRIGFAGELPIAYRGFGAAMRAIDDEASAMKAAHDRALDSLQADTAQHARQGLFGMMDSVKNAERMEYQSRRLALRREAIEDLVNDTWRNSRFLYGTWQLAHYSNGQDDAFFTDSVLRRANYSGGDFSTNYVIARLHHAWRFPTHDQVIVSGGARIDFGIGDLIGFSTEQERSYGRLRLLAQGVWRSRPVWLGTRIHKRLEHKGCYYTLKELFEVRSRVELEWIAGDMNLYPHQDRLQRGSVHLWLELIPLRSYTAGLFVHLYHGRDYLNIRYDRVVNLLMVGVSFAAPKYLPARWNPAGAAIVPGRPATFR
ncbi:MAG: hypothetical protein IPM46_02810 [Flavobacteriales bacterium]|nr:hypothetical protein [Flavobacteriales bacterium]